jgi:PAS domain S-box-containing protein
MLAGASLVQQQALESLAMPAVIIELPEGRVAAANQAAADLAGVPIAQMRGRLRADVVRFEDEAAVQLAVATLSEGDVHAYRARRRLISADGAVHDLLIWGRAVDLDGTRSAVFLLTPASSTAGGTPPLVWVEPMVVGTTDAQWRIVTVSTEIPEVLGGTQADFIGWSLLGAAHPDDAGDLLRMVATACAGEMFCRNVRLRHQDGSWVDLHLALAPLTDGKPSPLGFVMLPYQPDFAPAGVDRLSDLETRLRHIAAELRAAGYIDGVERLPSAIDHPELNRLSARQWQILIRLLRGERVPTIARELFLSAGTVRNHLAAVFSLFDVHSQAELLALLRTR